MATMTISPRVAGAQRQRQCHVVSTPSSSQRRNDVAVSSSIRLTTRGRRLLRTLLFVLALAIAASTAVFGHISASQASSVRSAAATSIVIVQPGQTMWGLAAQVAPNDDPRDTIERIAQLNSLTGAQASTVHPGQRLVVPAAG